MSPRPAGTASFLTPIALALAAVAAIGWPGKANACGCPCPSPCPVFGELTAAQADATTQLATSYATIATQLTTSMTQLTQNLTLPTPGPTQGAIPAAANQESKSNQRLAESLASIEDGDNLAETQQELQRIQLSASREFEPSFSTCQVASGAQGLTAATETARKNRMVFAGALQSRSTGSAGAPAARGQFTDIAYRSRNWGEKYCNPRRWGEVCETLAGSAGQTPGSGSPARPDADIQVDATLFAKATIQPPEGDGRDISDGEAAALELIMNLTEPFVPEKLPPAMLISSAGRRALNQRRSEDARMDLARASLLQLVSVRTAPPETDEGGTAIEPSGPWAREMLEDVGVPSDGIPDRISLYQIFEILSSKRFEGTGWYMKLQGMEPTNVDRETAQSLALLLQMEWETYNLMERLVALEATTLAMEVDDTREDLPVRLIPTRGTAP